MICQIFKERPEDRGRFTRAVSPPIHTVPTRPKKRVYFAAQIDATRTKESTWDYRPGSTSCGENRRNSDVRKRRLVRIPSHLTPFISHLPTGDSCRYLPEIQFLSPGDGQFPATCCLLLHVTHSALRTVYSVLCTPYRSFPSSFLRGASSPPTASPGPPRTDALWRWLARAWEPDSQTTTGPVSRLVRVIIHPPYELASTTREMVPTNGTF